MKKDYRIYYYDTVEKIGRGKYETFTYHHIQLETIILRVKSPWPGSVLKGSVSVMRPNLGFLERLSSFVYKLDLKEYLEKINIEDKVSQNVRYLLKNVEHELERIGDENERNGRDTCLGCTRESS